MHYYQYYAIHIPELKVDPSLIEAAKGIGMKPFRRLTKVELPIAMPVIMAGIHTAMVLIIGTSYTCCAHWCRWLRRSDSLGY